jgi:ketosteroid isomerase-like protein
VDGCGLGDNPSVSANLDLVRSIYADWERGDFSRTGWAYPEIELVISGGPDPGSWTGVAAMAGAWGDVLSAWEDVRPVPEVYRELDEERILVLAVVRGRGKTSRAATAWKETHLFRLHGGKVTKLVLYWDRDRALADLGLKE